MNEKCVSTIKIQISSRPVWFFCTSICRTCSLGGWSEIVKNMINCWGRERLKLYLIKYDAISVINFNRDKFWLTLEFLKLQDKSLSNYKYTGKKITYWSIRNRKEELRITNLITTNKSMKILNRERFSFKVYRKTKS